MSAEAKDDVSEEDEDSSNLPSQNDGEYSGEKSRPSSNIYTPLLTGARLLATPANASRLQLDSNIPTDIISKSAAVQHQTRGHRSSVRPFFCCGSEVSLVSLVDNLHLKDEQASDVSKFNKIECTERSSEEEDSTLSCNQSGNISVPSSGQSLLRKKKKDKHAVKKKSWSLRLRGRWNTQWRVAHPQRHRVDLSQHSSMGFSQGTSTGRRNSIGSPSASRRVSRPHNALKSSQHMSLSQVNSLDSLGQIDEAVRTRERSGESGQDFEIDQSLPSHALRPNLDFSNSMLDMLHQRRFAEPMNSESSRSSPGISSEEDYSHIMNNFMLQLQESRNGFTEGRNSLRVYTQVDYMHCLVPCLLKITNCPFYWGTMDRHEAQRHLDNKPEGTFLLRDSAQEDFLFSVSFRRYNRSLHARVEQLNHQFSFDAHDPCVFSAPSVCELMEHYKDPSSCMFFEPMLTRPLSRNFTFTLQHICRAVICDSLVYDQIQDLPIPNCLKLFLQAYHYKEKVRVRHFDGSGNQVMIG
ncbi:hypothetical protein EGW08_002595 [Elysia chlorotica]|uniref:Suppressor of cytokine signaling 5 n=1 Tax=Elysia chlorotica TaxID=188477 RepID=A0A433U7A7_ELYCH|nr:hypothetical protein EGW08_002595 [Elysia chlorotica]